MLCGVLAGKGRRAAHTHLKTKLRNLFKVLWLLSILRNRTGRVNVGDTPARVHRGGAHSLCGLNGKPAHFSPSFNELSPSSALAPYFTACLLLSLVNPKKKP